MRSAGSPTSGGVGSVFGARGRFRRALPGASFVSLPILAGPSRGRHATPGGDMRVGSGTRPAGGSETAGFSDTRRSTGTCLRAGAAPAGKQPTVVSQSEI